MERSFYLERGDSDVTRRQLVSAVGTAVATGLAGCNSTEFNPADSQTLSETESKTETSTATQTGTETETASETETDEPEPRFVHVIPGFSDREFSRFESRQEAQREKVTLEFETELNRHYEQFDRLVEHNESWQTWFDSIPDDSSFEELKKLDIGAIYPMRTDREEYDQFLFDKFESAEPTLEALDWVHTYSMAWAAEKERNTDGGFNNPFKDLNFRLAPFIEKSVNEYTENRCHIFPVDLHDEGDGNYVANIGRDGDNLYKMMMGFDLETKQLIVLESTYLNQEVSSVQEQFMNYRTERPRYDDGNWAQHTYDNGRLSHHTVQNSVYLPDIGKDGFEDAVEEKYGDEFDVSTKPPATDYWHPLRFDGTEPDMDELDFRTASVLTARMLRNVATHPETSDTGDRLGDDAGTAPTREYRASIPEAMLAMSGAGTGSIDFPSVFAQAALLDELARREGNYVVYGTAFEPKYGRVRDEQVVDEIWNDQQGEYDQIETVLN